MFNTASNPCLRLRPCLPSSSSSTASPSTPLLAYRRRYLIGRCSLQISARHVCFASLCPLVAFIFFARPPRMSSSTFSCERWVQRPCLTVARSPHGRSQTRPPMLTPTTSTRTRNSLRSVRGRRLSRGALPLEPQNARASKSRWGTC